MAFQNTAQNYTEERLNHSDLVHLSPYSTFFVHSGRDCPDAGIIKGSILAVDSALTPQYGQIIVTEIFDGELVLRRLLNPVPALQALSEDNTRIFIDVSAELPVCGVVAYAITDVVGLVFTSQYNG